MGHSSRHDQRGMVAIVVTMIMMIVITLIVLGFSEATRNNQREALDTRLGTQAYYAAEAGVNDAQKAISSILSSTTPTAIPSQPSCTNFSISGTDAASGVPFSYALPRNLGENGAADDSVANTCLMIDPYPKSLKAPLDEGSAVVWDVKDPNPAMYLRKLKFSWTPDKSFASTPSPNCTTPQAEFPQYPTWLANCDHAVLRVDLVKTPTAYDVTSLELNTKTFYLKPGSGGSSTVSVGGARAYIGTCSPTAGNCEVTIDTGAAFASNEYYVRLTTLYEGTKEVTLTACSVTAPALSCATPGTTEFSNGQVVVDSTGRAQDQTKRIQVRIPFVTSALIPAFGVQSTMTICKDMTVSKNDPTIYDEGLCGGSTPTGDEGVGISGGVNPFEGGIAGTYSYRIQRVVVSFYGVAASDVDHCTIEWGDGSPVDDSRTAGFKCELGAKMQHQYTAGPTDPTGACTTGSSVPGGSYYNVTFKVYKKSGGYVQDVNRVHLPYCLKN